MSFWNFICGLTAGISNCIASSIGCYPMYPAPYGGVYMPYMGRGCMPFLYGRRQPFLLFNNAANSLIGGGCGAYYWGGGAGSTPRIDTNALNIQAAMRARASMLQISLQDVSSDYSQIVNILKSIDSALEDKDGKLTETMRTQLKALKIDLEDQKDALQPYIDKAKENNMGDTQFEDLKAAHQPASTVIKKANDTFAEIQKELAKKETKKKDDGEATEGGGEATEVADEAEA